MVHRTAPFSMTFQGLDNIQHHMTPLIVSGVWSIEWCRFQRPSVTPNLDFMVPQLLPSMYCVRSWRALCLQ